MTLRHLSVFIAVVDAGCSITKASQLLNIAQPSVSQTVIDLEQYYNVRLFDRLNRKLYLTGAGKTLLGYARHVTDSFSQMEQAISSASGTAPLRIGASFTVGTVLLPALLKTLPLPVDVSVYNTHILERAVLESRLDAALVEGHIVSRDIIRHTILEDELVFAASPEYLSGNLTESAGRYAETESAAADTLPVRPVFILREQGSGTRELAEEMIAGIPHMRTWSAANTQTIIALVKAGCGATVISRALILPELHTGALVEAHFLHDGTPIKKRPRNFKLVYHKDKFIDERLELFCKTVHDYAQNLPDSRISGMKSGTVS